MRMIVNKVEYENSMIIVNGVTNIGTIRGIWKFEETPIVSEEYFVELNIGELYKSQISIKYDNMEHSAVCLCEDHVLFTGRCEDIDDIYYIRFADDWLEMIEIVDNPIDIKKGDCVSFMQRYNCIWIYPY